MADVVFVFKVHQPHRLKRGFFWEHRMFQRLSKEELYNYYFDDVQNREIFERAAMKCYFPANEILIQLIDDFKNQKRKVRLSFSVSGVFLEQCERFSPDLLETFRQLSASGCVEFLDQPYYHSLVGLYPVRDEFVEQVRMHQRIMKELLNSQPTTFENTELIYNNAVAKVVDQLGYEGIFTEGIDKILHGRSPNFVYKAKACQKLRVLLRNFKLTDDIGFRFSVRSWSGWPLTADKYASWLREEQGNCVVIFPDYETFGEHHWPETGIHEFLRHMPPEILKIDGLTMATPSEVLTKHRPVGEVDVPELGGTVSWADVARDTSGWLGNTMQWAYYTTTRDLEPLVKESKNDEFFRLWRYFLVSDHLYYMFTAGGTPGEVHMYFSPYERPIDAFVTAQGAIFDFEARLRAYVYAANEPFLFYNGPGEDHFTGIKAWSLAGLVEALRKMDITIIEFHNRKGDFEKWAAFSLRDQKLSKDFEIIRLSNSHAEKLRQDLYNIAKSRWEESKRLVRVQTEFLTVKKTMNTP